MFLAAVGSVLLSLLDSLISAVPVKSRCQWLCLDLVTLGKRAFINSSCWNMCLMLNLCFLPCRCFFSPVKNLPPCREEEPGVEPCSLQGAEGQTGIELRGTD